MISSLLVVWTLAASPGQDALVRQRALEKRFHAMAQQAEQASDREEELRQRLARVEAALEEERTADSREEEEVEARTQRTASLEEVLAGLRRADATLEAGSFEADAELARAEQLVGTAGDESNGAERAAAQAARSALTSAREALGRRDFQQARAWTFAAYQQTLLGLRAVPAT